MAKWSISVRTLAEKKKLEIMTVVKESAIYLSARVVARSPVDTGRFRANWYASINKPDHSTTEGVDPAGNAAQAYLASVIGQMKEGDSIFITNSLPYAQRLENGWSKQAPLGMVRLTVREFNTAVTAALRKAS